MLEAILYGLGMGTVLSLMLGTVFFALIQNSIDFGYQSGIFIASGVVVSDCMFITVAMLGTSLLPQIPHLSFYSSLVGGVLLIFLGLHSILSKKPKVVYPKTKLGNQIYYFSTGFLLNLLNPVNFLFWAAIITKLQIEKAFSFQNQLIFFVFCLFATFCSEVLISYFASRLSKVFTPLVLRRINQVSGIFFVCLGIKLLYDAYLSY